MVKDLQLSKPLDLFAGESQAANVVQRLFESGRNDVRTIWRQPAEVELKRRSTGHLMRPVRSRHCQFIEICQKRAVLLRNFERLHLPIVKLKVTG